ncbi:DUF393 domain-containing protein [Tamlana fucoidanivorans]|uniref:DUF393 domain-containing protein n=1 Tax=Allotamlana fucoidanivorans TaxID=2583814 RepID=A0A5C4SQG9_9FLAO|nr:DUF393 domain-containing protein [Tamlana fucoidanivorans]TNJ46522.1 DUF393 domain-containing protein [Tamlana fucoidanivorans]
MEIAIEKNKKLILFDGVCNLCNSSVQYVIKRDKNNLFLFAPLQSKTGYEILKTFQIDSKKTDSILLYNPSTHKINYKSTAALNIASKLRFPTNLLGIFLVIPVCIRNWVYDFIAKNRYKWFGKQDACMVPTSNLKDKFLS